MRHHHQPTTVAILGGNPVATNALALLLEDQGYTIRLLEEYPTGRVEELLDGVDLLLLLTADLPNGARDVLLSVVRGNPKTAAMPVLTLSTAPREALSDQASMVLLWPTRLEDLRKAIEDALKPATSGEG